MQLLCDQSGIGYYLSTMALVLHWATIIQGDSKFVSQKRIMMKTLQTQPFTVILTTFFLLSEAGLK